MRIRKLTMKAFGPFKDEVTIDFHKNNIESGLLLITGETGAGKTTIFDAVCYALYGEASGESRQKTSLRSDFVDDNTDTVVTLDFEHNGHDYQITRAIRMTTKARELKQQDIQYFEINGRKLTNKTEVDSAVKELLSLDFSQFSQVAMLAQGEFSRFLLAEPNDKKVIFRKIFNSDNYNMIMEKLAVVAKDLNAKRKTAAGILEAAKNKLEDIDHNSMTDSQLIETIEKKIASDRKVVTDNLKKRDEFGSLKNALTLEHDRQSTVNQHINDLQKTEKDLLRLRENNRGIEEDRKQLQYNRTAGMEITAVLKAVSDLDRSISDYGSRITDNRKKLQRANENMRKKQQDFLKLDSYSEDHQKLIEEKRVLETELEKLKKYSQLGIEITGDREHLSHQMDIYDREHAVLQELERKFYLGQACVLADMLKDGEPCPVCGSVHHPDPAVGSADDVTRKQLENQRKKVNDAENREIIYKTRIEQKLDQQKKLGITGDTDIAAKQALTKEAIREIENRIGELDDNYRKLSDMKGKLEREIAGYKAAARNLNESFRQRQKNRGEKAEQLKDLYVRYETSREEYEKRLLDRTALKSLEDKIREYDRMLNKLTAQKETLVKLVEGKSFVDLTEMEQQLKQVSRQWEQADQLYSRNLGKLEALKGSLKDIRKYSKEYHEIDSEYAVAQELSSIANGKHAGMQKIDFENYVLSYYLNNVLIQANARLSRMTENRYRLARKENASGLSDKLGLRFVVYDAVTNKEREVGSLSGGEKFKAALALALGLSDVISMYAGGIKLDCLFVDEGFGSLDSNSLDQALNTLSDLSDGDKLVAIISHVPELENRIDRQIVIKKSNNGSRIVVRA